MSTRILIGDVREKLAELPDESVHCVVTSPPYWGLRDYGADGQLGLEVTLGEHVAVMVDVFREVRRVLRSDGTLWLNYGDSYATSDKASMLKPKDLCGVPWRVALALQEDGWWLRQDIIWSKPNPMPESIRDRCTKAHEYLFLLSKSERYYFDQEAIAEPVALASVERLSRPTLDQQRGSDRVPGKTNGPMKAVGGRPGGRKPEKFDALVSGAGRSGIGEGLLTRNRRSVWEIPTQPFSEAHFATFPPALVEPCILAGCPIGGTVLDPFAGSGTTGMVADRLGRDAILIDLNPAYAAMARRRIEQDAGLFADVAD